jgi:hypothetical protein
MQMENVAVPIDLSAFVLTPECADSDGPARIGIISQPNYLGLRLDEALMTHDLLDPVDFHLTSPAKCNPRLTEVGAFLDDTQPPKYRRNRMGVYLHWSLPRCYRAARKAQENPGRTRGDRSDKEDDDLSVSQFPTVPNRWLVVRRLTHQVSEDGIKLPDFQTWIVESNRVRKIQEIDDFVDIEVEVSPFTRGNNDPTNSDWKNVLENQAENFIGKRNEYSGWNSMGPRWTEEETGAAGNLDFLDLTVLGASNPVFPDYVPHNGSVFSIIDNFKYRTKDGSTKYLTEATADYFVMGWCSLAKNDLLNPAQPPLFQTTLDSLKLALLVPENTPTKKKDHIASMLGAKQGTRSVFHGAMYGVVFKWGTKPPSKAEKMAAKFGPDFPLEPLSAGVTPLDGIMTFLRAHKDDGDINRVFEDSGAGDIAQMILNLSELLYAANDSFDERAKAQDLNMYQALYAKSTTAGYHWIFAEPSDQGQPPKIPTDPKSLADTKIITFPKTPTDSQYASLLSLNEKQARIDAAERKVKQKRWDLFAQWWKYVSDKTNIQHTVQDKYKTRVGKLVDEIRGLESSIIDLRPDLTSALQNPSFKRVPRDPFYSKKEPTIAIAGLESGWPKDFMDAIPVRVDGMLLASDGIEKVVFPDVPSITSPFPLELKDTALKLLHEAVSSTASSVSSSKIPMKGFQAWGPENPFEPLFVEWEARYYHIDFSKWAVQVRSSPVGLPISYLRYGIPELLSSDQKGSNLDDFRYVSGRTLILPQPVFSLKSAVKAVLDSNDPSSPYKSAADKSTLLSGIDKLPFMSCPLSGVQEHLLTRVMGTHVKPIVNNPGKTNIPLPPAVQLDIGFTEDVLKLIDSSRYVFEF